MLKDSVHAVILAGGSGQRFWPLSRELSPKQMLTVFGHESLIAQAIHRVDSVVMPGAVTIVTNERLFDELRNHLTAQPDPRMRDVTYLVEPVPRNTAAAIAYAAATREIADPDGIIIVLPSDHLLESAAAWSECLNAAVSAAELGYLVTIGVTPTRAEVGYGYIQQGAELAGLAFGVARPHAVTRFVEKPDLAHAEELLRDGGYHWNAGIFIMRASRVLEELASHADTAPIAATARWLAAGQREGSIKPEVARERFGALPALSFDHAVMERSDRVAVIPTALEWSDIGSLLALGQIAPPDDAGNVRTGRGIDIESADSIIYSTDRLVATLGVRDLLVIDTADATLVASKDRAQDVRLVVDALRARGADEVVAPKESLRPWGSWMSLLTGPNFQIKLLQIKPGEKPSLQRHEHRAEHWVVVAGAALVTRDQETIHVATNESVYIPLGAVHRIENRGDELLKVIEVQVGEYLGEDDIVRIEDDWNREG